jgi:lipoyl(octanoyl) transferase
LDKEFSVPTPNYFLLCEHPNVYTLGKSGNEQNLLVTENYLKNQGAEFYKINRGGDITYHGPGQIVGYPILDLENFYLDIHRYMRDLEEVIIQTMAEFGIIGERLKGATGVWIESETPKARKICAMGVRASRWVTMHGFALNVNTDLTYFTNINPCGFIDKGVTSFEKELGRKVNLIEVQQVIKNKFESVFQAQLITD